MRDVTRRSVLGGLAAVPVVGALGARADTGPALLQFAPPESGRETMRRRFFPNVELISHEGKHVRFYDDLLKDKIVVLNLMYANCESLCPVITSHLVEVQKLLRTRVQEPVYIYSLTIKPDEDTPAKLREYATMHRAGGNWLFLTGKPDDLELLRFKLGYNDPKPERDRADKSLHSGMLRYGNEPLSLWGSCQGSATPGWIAEEISFVAPHRRPS